MRPSRWSRSSRGRTHRASPAVSQYFTPRHSFVLRLQCVRPAAKGGACPTSLVAFSWPVASVTHGSVSSRRCLQLSIELHTYRTLPMHGGGRSNQSKRRPQVTSRQVARGDLGGERGGPESVWGLGIWAAYDGETAAAAAAASATAATHRTVTYTEVQACKVHSRSRRWPRRDVFALRCPRRQKVTAPPMHHEG